MIIYLWKEQGLKIWRKICLWTKEHMGNRFPQAGVWLHWNWSKLCDDRHELLSAASLIPLTKTSFLIMKDSTGTCNPERFFFVFSAANVTGPKLPESLLMSDTIITFHSVENMARVRNWSEFIVLISLHQDSAFANTSSVCTKHE